MTGVFRREKLRDKLLGDWIDAKNTTHKQFVHLLKDWKEDIFEPGEVPDNIAAPFHALAMQLVAKRIIAFDIKDESHSSIGTDKLRHDDVVVKLGRKSDDRLVLLDDDAWEGLNFV